MPLDTYTDHSPNNPAASMDWADLYPDMDYRKAKLQDWVTAKIGNKLYYGQVDEIDESNGSGVDEIRYIIFDQEEEIDRYFTDDQIVSVGKIPNFSPFPKTPSQEASDETTKECRRIVDEALDKSVITKSLA